MSSLQRQETAFETVLRFGLNVWFIENFPQLLYEYNFNPKISRLSSEQERSESNKKREEEQVKLQNQMHRDYKKNVEATFEKMQADFNQSMKSAIADLSLNLKAEAWNALVFFYSEKVSRRH